MKTTLLITVNLLCALPLVLIAGAMITGAALLAMATKGHQ